MKKITRFLGAHNKLIALLAVGAVGLGLLLLYRLVSLTHGLSVGEASQSHYSYNWHNLLAFPLYLPFDGLRTLGFELFNYRHVDLIARLPSVLYGAIAIISLGLLLRLWHGTRTAIMGTVLFATAAWTLHVSRLACIEVVYLAVLPLMLLLHVALQRAPTRKLLFFANIVLFSLLLSLPGLVWLVALNIFWLRDSLKQGWLNLGSWWLRVLAVLAGLLWIPVVARLFSLGLLKQWVGLPEHLASPLQIGQHIAEVPFYLFIHMPYNPVLWLGRAPLLDVFSLLTCVVGLFFYATHWKAGRSRMIGSFLVLGIVLIGLGGGVGFSLVVPLLYICAAAGIGFLLREWLQVFPLNPIARSIGIGLVVAVVALACLYNLRAYFIAWPHNSNTEAIFTVLR